MFDIFQMKKEGPGVFENTPRKKGLGRFFEILGRDFGPIYGSSLIALIAYLPGAFLVTTAVIGQSVFWTLIYGIVGGMIGAPFYTVLIDTILRAQRDEPGYWWVRYRKAFKNDAKASLLPGAIFGALLSTQVYCAFVVLPQTITLPFLTGLFASVLFTVFIAIWVFPQIALFNLSFFKILRNSILLAFSTMPRTFGAAVFIIAYWVAVALYFPLSIVVLFITGMWFPFFCAMSCIYPALDKQFEVEKQINEKTEQAVFGTPSI